MKELRTAIAKKASKILEAQAEVAEAPMGEAPLAEEAPVAEEKHDDLEAKVDELSKKIDSLAEALEQLIVIEEEEGHEDLEDLKEKEEEKEDKEVTPDEAGLEAPEMVAATAAKDDLGGHDKTVADDFEKDKSDKAQQKLEAPAPQITKVKQDKDLPAMLKLADLAFEQKADKCIVIDASDEKNERPVYEIPNVNGEDNFSSFVEGLIKRMQTEGVDAVLQAVGAVECTAEPAPVAPTAPAVDAPKPEEKKPELPKAPAPVTVAEKKPEEKEEVKTPVVKASDIQRKFVRAFNLAITALNKNLITNPLKKAFAAKLDSLGMDESEIVRVVESAFAEGAKEHFASALAQTEKYLAMSDEAFVETEAMIGELNVVKPQVTASRDLDDEANELRARASRNSLPIVTNSEQPAERKDLLREALPKPKNWSKKDMFRKIK